MSKFGRALFVTAVATGAAFAVWKLMQPASSKSEATPPRKETSDDLIDRMTPEQQDALLKELAAQL